MSHHRERERVGCLAFLLSPTILCRYEREKNKREMIQKVNMIVLTIFSQTLLSLCNYSDTVVTEIDREVMEIL